MRTQAVFGLVIGLSIAMAAPVLAQRLPFERSFDVNGVPKLDVSTIRGKIDVTAGDAERVVVSGTVTVRVGWDVPANALEIARRIADHPRIERDGNTIRLRPPTDSADQRAVTVSYQLKVPPNTEILAVSDSGATTIRGISGQVVVRTQSAAIELGQLGGSTSVTTGSGAVIVDGVVGALTVTTSSSTFTGRNLQGSVRVRTQSGTVDAALAGQANVDVESGSSGIRVQGVRGPLTLRTESGHLDIDGVPGGPWDLSTASGGLTIAFGSGAAFNVEATSRSGSLTIEGAAVDGSIDKRRIAGTIGGGGPLVRIVSRSGSLRARVGGG